MQSACQGTAKSKRVELADLNLTCSTHPSQSFFCNNASLSFNLPTLFFSPSFTMSYLSPEKAESELTQSIKKATSIEESAPKQKHVRSKLACHPRSFSTPLNSPSRSRMYCLHLGPSYVCCHLEYPKGAATVVWRSPNVQGTHHGAQDYQGRPSQCKTQRWQVSSIYLRVMIGHQRCSSRNRVVGSLCTKCDGRWYSWIWYLDP